MRCSSCGNDYCHLVEESETHTKGYGIFKGCCGYLILGPIGWVCGLCGMGEGYTRRKSYWVCERCGKKFSI